MSDRDSDLDDEAGEADISHLGILQTVAPWTLRSKFFPSKVGGLPAWLSLSGLPTAEQLQCGVCSGPTKFLLQLYCPIEKEECFHRTLFLFVCPKGECSKRNESSNFRVFRDQLPRENAYYSANAPVWVEENSENPSPDQSILCWYCHCYASNKCAKCHKATYCSKAHQTADWKGGHKAECGKIEGLPAPRNGSFFAESEIVIESYIEEESEEEESSSDDETPSSLEVELEKFARKEKKDSEWKRFKAFCDDNPDAVVRHDRDGRVLHVSVQHNSTTRLLPCEKCGADRRFEFQVLPQLLNTLKLDAVGDSIDWGTITIFTCSADCASSLPERGCYIQELVLKEDFTDDK